MSIYVYLGPTLRVSEARKLLPDAIFLPPASQSDILSLVVNERPGAILLIDGLFMQSLSVWHKEILYALEHGVAVYGASSMGALRASETACFGAVGIGKIFEAYVSGELTDDDEVAVVHAPAELEFVPASEAMVNIRATLAAAKSQGVLTLPEHDVLVGLAKRRFFPERSYGQLLADAAGADISATTLARLQEFIRVGAIDQKREDAVSLLQHVREHGYATPAPIQVTRSHVFMAMYHRDRRVNRKGVSLSLADIGAHAALHLPGFDELNEHALNGALVDVLAERLSVQADAAQIDAERQRFCVRQQLKTAEDVMQWLSANHLTEAEFDEFIQKLAVRRRLRDWYVSRKYLERTTQDVLDELRVRGLFAASADAAARQAEILQATHQGMEQLKDDATLLELIREHARQTHWRPKVDIATWAFESGFKDVMDVQYELIKAKLARRAMASIADTLKGLRSENTGLVHGRLAERS